MEMNMTQHWVRMVLRTLTISLPESEMAPEVFCRLFLVCLCFLRFWGTRPEGGVSEDQDWGCLSWAGAEGLFQDWIWMIPMWLLVPSAALYLAWMLRVLVSVSADGRSLADFTLSYRAPFFMLQICYSVLLSVIEAFDSPGSAGTDIKSAGWL